MERGEAAKQQLEYELLKVKKALNDERRQALEREASLSEINKSLNGIYYYKGLHFYWSFTQIYLYKYYIPLQKCSY